MTLPGHFSIRLFKQDDFQKTKLTHYAIKLNILLGEHEKKIKLLKKSFIHCAKYQTWLEIKHLLKHLLLQIL